MLSHFQWATMLSYFSELRHSSCYTTQSFSTATVFSHLQMATMNSIIFTIVLRPFMILSVILKILSDILLQCSIILWFWQPFSGSCESFCYNAQPFYKITQSHYSKMTQSFSNFCQPFFKTTDAGLWDVRWLGARSEMCAGRRRIAARSRAREGTWLSHARARLGRACGVRGWALVDLVGRIGSRWWTPGSSP
jgi:hypothetical protein